MTTPAIDYSAVKTRQRAAWGTGNYTVVGTTLQLVGESLCEALDVHAGSRVLDVAAGNGNASLAAAHRWCEVTSTDYVWSLLESGRKRAEAEGLHLTFQEADAENLPFADRSFDAVLSTFGVMFAPDQEKAASEMLRVCRRGGKIGMANWTPTGFIGQLFKLIGSYVPPAPGVKSPALWGTPTRLKELFGSSVSIHTTIRYFSFRYRNAEHFIDVFRTFYGPMNRTFAALESDPVLCATFAKELQHLVESGNRSGNSTLVVPSEYLEVVIKV
jgi:ubiquinone/menaquinone biosynthesis C-methylase UbiE